MIIIRKRRLDISNYKESLKNIKKIYGGGNINMSKVKQKGNVSRQFMIFITSTMLYSHNNVRDSDQLHIASESLIIIPF